MDTAQWLIREVWEAQSDLMSSRWEPERAAGNTLCQSLRLGSGASPHLPFFLFCLGFRPPIQRLNRKQIWGTYLVVQWLRIHLPMQWTLAWFLAGELRSHKLWGNKVCAAQPSLWSTKTEPVRSRACMTKLERSPRAIMKSPCAAAKTQYSQNTWISIF